MSSRRYSGSDGSSLCGFGSAAASVAVGVTDVADVAVGDGDGLACVRCRIVVLVDPASAVPLFSDVMLTTTEIEWEGEERTATRLLTLLCI